MAPYHVDIYHQMPAQLLLQPAAMQSLCGNGDGIAPPRDHHFRRSYTPHGASHDAYTAQKAHVVATRTPKLSKTLLLNESAQDALIVA